MSQKLHNLLNILLKILSTTILFYLVYLCICRLEDYQIYISVDTPEQIQNNSNKVANLEQWIIDHQVVHRLTRLEHDLTMKDNELKKMLIQIQALERDHHALVDSLENKSIKNHKMKKTEKKNKVINNHYREVEYIDCLKIKTQYKECAYSLSLNCKKVKDSFKFCI